MKSLLFGMGALLLVAAAPAASVSAEAPHAALNQVYERIAEGKAAVDADRALAAFDDRVVSVGPRAGPVAAGDAFHQRFRTMAQRIMNDQVSVEADYRIEHREIFGDTAVDAGFMRHRFSRAGTPGQVQYSRFLVTLQRQPNGQWKIIADASAPADEQAWAGVERRPGLKFDA